MLDALRKKWDEQPLVVIIFLATFFRILSVIFSKGYGMHDDHFLIIEPAQSWVDNFDYNDWFNIPPPHSLFYTGLHFLFLKGFHTIGIYDPQVKVFFVRLLHALISLATIIAGYKIANHYSGKKTARIVGLLLAIYWFMPFLSVRNLVEIACIPFLILAVWLLINNTPKKYFINCFIAGALCGFAFSIRYQTILFTGGLGLVLLFQKKWRETILLAIGSLLIIILLEGVVDFFIWDKSFTAFAEYVRFNVSHANAYFTQPWYNYFLLLGGILIPPISIFLFFGFFRSWKKYLILFLPSFIFLAFHSYFPNKQERFILPIVPFIIILGIMGWNEFISQSVFWQKRKKLLTGCWIFFWTLNLVALPVVSVAYTKKSYVEAMTYLSEQKDYKRLIMEESNRDGYSMPPFFYLGKWYTEGYIQTITSQFSIDSVCNMVKKYPTLMPNYVLFLEEENIEGRISNFKKCFPNLKYETTIQPGFIDKLVHWLNPINRNSVVTIYKINE